MLLAGIGLLGALLSFRAREADVIAGRFDTRYLEPWLATRFPAPPATTGGRA